jgi:hypothetical protein
MKKILNESLFEYLNEKEVFKGHVETGLTIDDVDKKEFLIGLAVEKKHSKSLGVQRELVFQNLSSNPKFYSESIKKGLFDDIEVLNLYKKYFIDKDDPEESSEEDQL